MFPTFFFTLRQAGVPVSVREYLTLLQAAEAGAAGVSVEDFYYLSRTALVKDERHLDRFDQVFGHVFKGVVSEGDEAAGVDIRDLPADWLERLAEKYLSDEEKAEIAALGGFEKLIETLAQRLAEQEKRHQGGSKWIGTAGTSPFGAYGYNPEGVRIGQTESRHRRAVKVWDKRDFRNLDDDEALGPRNMRVALRRLRKFARTGAAETLDIDGTIAATAANAGWLDLKMEAERHNAVNVLLLFDIGGSMDDHIRTCEALFSAARSEFHNLEYFYFHNCPYEYLWRDNRRRHDERIATMDVIHKYGAEYKLIVVGDAAMSPYEIVQPGGSVEHWNAEPGRIWMARLTETWRKAAWLNPTPERLWGYTPSIGMIGAVMEGRMFPLTLDGVDRAMRALM